MKELSVRPRVALNVLPTWDAQYKGAVVYQLSDNKLYYASDSAWVQIGSGGGGTPGGSSGSIQFNNAGAFAGATNVGVDNGDLVLTQNSSPVLPTDGTVKLFGKSMANRMLPAAVGPSGLDAVMQPSLWRQKIGRWNPQGNDAAYVPMVDGFYAVTALGSYTPRTVDTTNLFTRTRRFGLISLSGTAQFAGHYVSVKQLVVGNGAGLGGFFYSVRFGMSSAVSIPTSRVFVGLSQSTLTPNNVDPSTASVAIGVAKDAADTNFRIVYGGSAAQPSIDLGANFPANTQSEDLYEFTLYSPPSLNGVVYYRVERLGTSYVAEGTLGPGTPGVTLPSNTTLLTHRLWACNNTSASVIAVDVAHVYIETDF